MSNIQQPQPQKGLMNQTGFEKTASTPLDNNQFMQSQQSKEKVVNKQQKKMRIGVEAFDFKQQSVPIIPIPQQNLAPQNSAPITTSNNTINTNNIKNNNITNQSNVFVPQPTVVAPANNTNNQIFDQLKPKVEVVDFNKKQQQQSDFNIEDVLQTQQKLPKMKKKLKLTTNNTNFTADQFQVQSNVLDVLKQPVANQQQQQQQQPVKVEKKQEEQQQEQQTLKKTSSLNKKISEKSQPAKEEETIKKTNKKSKKQQEEIINDEPLEKEYIPPVIEEKQEEDTWNQVTTTKKKVTKVESNNFVEKKNNQDNKKQSNTDKKQDLIKKQEQIEKEKKQKEEEQKLRLKQEEEEKEKERLRKEAEEAAKIPKVLTYDFIINFFLNKENQGTDLLNESCLAITQRKITVGEYQHPKKNNSYTNSINQHQKQNSNNNKQNNGQGMRNKNNYNNQQQQQGFQTGVIKQQSSDFSQPRHKKPQNGPVEHSFQRQQVSMEEVKLRNQILNNTGKFMEQAKLDNQDEKKKILKDIKYHCQTLSPDNIDVKLQKLLVHTKDEYGKKCLVDAIIEKGCTQPKYVSTYANLCYSIISELKNNPEYKESKDNSFKSQIIGRFQTMFAQEFILDKPDLFKNMDEKSIEKYFKRNKEKLFQFVIFIGELHKVKVIPFKLAQICQNLILVNYLETFFFQFQDDKKIQDDDKYIYNNDQLEALIVYIENIGRIVEEREKKEKIAFQESQNAIIDEIIAGIKSEQKDFDFNKYKEKPEQFTIEFYIKFLKKMQEEKLCEKRIQILILNLEDQKNRGWEQSLSKQNTTAVSKSEVQSQHQKQLEQSEQNAKSYDNRGDNKGRGNQRNNPQKYQPKGTNSLRQQKSQQGPSKEELLEKLREHGRRDPKTPYDEQFKKIQLEVVRISGENEQKNIEALAKQCYKQQEIDVLPMLFQSFINGTEEQTIKYAKTAAQVLIKYYADKNSENLIYEIFQKMFEDGYSEESDFPYMCARYGEVLAELRENNIIKLDQLIISTQDDEDEDEELYGYINKICKSIVKATQKEKQNETLTNELKGLFANLKKNLTYPDANEEDYKKLLE